MRVLIAALMALPLINARPVLAQQTAQAQPKPAQDQFVPVDRPMNQQDTLPAPRMLAAAYAFVWVALLVYLWSIWRRLGTVEKEIAAVSRRIGSGGGSV
jgi:CcmD family protein